MQAVGAQVAAQVGAQCGWRAPVGGSCSPPIPDSSDDEDDAPALHLTGGHPEKATVTKLAALVVA
jgi:hypothetical protein